MELENAQTIAIMAMADTMAAAAAMFTAGGYDQFIVAREELLRLLRVFTAH